MFSLRILLFFTLTTVLSVAQQFEVHKYGIRDGLSIELTKSVTQDTFGFIWVATDEGLSRFDGYSFKSFNSIPEIAFSKEIIRRKNGNLLAVSDLGIFEVTPRLDSAIVKMISKGSREFSRSTIWYPKSIFEAKDGTIFAGEQGSIIRIKDGNLKKYPLDKADFSYNFLRAHHFFETEAGELFIVAHNGGIFRFDFRNDRLIPAGRLNNTSNIAAIKYLGNLKFLAGNNLGVTEVQLVREKNNEFKIASSKKYFPELNISSFLLKNGLVLAGTWDRGVYSFKIDKEISNLQHLVEVGEIKINTLFLAKDDDIWLCSESGLILLNYRLFNPVLPSVIKQYIQDIITIKDNKAFVSDGNTLYEIVINGSNITYKIVLTVPDNVIISICRFKDGVLASLSNGELVYLDDNGNRTTIRIERKGKFFRYLSYGVSDDLWMIEEGAKEIINLKSDMSVKRYDVSHCPIDAYSIIFSNQKNEVFAAGTASKIELIKLDPKKEKFEPMKISSDLSINGEITVNDMDFDRANNPVIATSKGVFVIAGGKATLLDRSFNRVNVRSVSVDNVNFNYWIGTSDGLYRFDGQSISHFDVISGLPSKTIGSRTLTIDPSGNIWVGTAEGVALMRGVFKIEISDAAKLILANKKNDVSFSQYDKSIEILEGENWFIKALNFTYPTRSILYQYRFSEKDEWINLSDGNIIPLEGIGSGSFKVEVRTRQHGNHSWSEVSSLEFTIVPYWYKRWWAILLWVLLMTVIVYTIARIYARNLQKENLLLEKTVSERTSELSSKNAELEKSQNEVVSKNKALEVLLTDLRDINATKDKMFSIISHDLKNPFTTIMGFSEILKDDLEDMTNVEVKDFVTRIYSTSKRTYELLENLLGWSRAQSGSLSITKSGILLLPIVKKVADLATDTAFDKQLTIRTELQPDLMVNADPNALETILRNLLVNAIKFSIPGKEILISAVTEGPLIKISVVDQGVGMNEETLNKLFRNDLHFTTSGTQQERGTGLGLILCKELVEKHGGNISVKSKPAEGSTFTFTLPV